MKNNTAIIIQARSQSTRLPNKLFLPFYKTDRIIDLFIKTIIKAARQQKISVILATTLNKADNIFEAIAKNYDIFFYKGSEQDVLERFIQASEQYQVDTIVRVCADNPIYDIESTLKLVPHHLENGNDYTAYQLKGGLPSIKSHLGLWGEVVSASALKKIKNITQENLYREHVTNYIYTFPDIFKIQLKNAPDSVFERLDIRLTVDTQDDFALMQKIYSSLFAENNSISAEHIVRFLDRNPFFLYEMKKNIKKNTK